MTVRDFLATPAHSIAEGIAKVYNHDTRKSRLFVGAGLILLGSTIATNYPEGSVIPHSLWDSVAYLIHGFGATPLIERFLGSE